MSRLKLLRLGAGLALGISASIASAGFVDIIEGPDGTTAPVTVSTDLLSITGGSPITSATPETMTLDGFLFPATAFIPVTSSLRSAGLFEPGTTVLSDLVIVEVGDVTSACPPGIDQCQELKISFFSDAEGGPPLESLIPPNTFGGALVEDGTLQNLSHFLGTSGFGVTGVTIRVLSDTEAVPEPASLALVGLGLAAMGWGRRKRV